MKFWFIILGFYLACFAGRDSAFLILTLPVDAKIDSLTGGLTVIADTPSAFLYNPASSAYFKKIEFSLTSSFYIWNTSCLNLSAVIPSEDHSFSANFGYFGSGEIDSYDKDRNKKLVSVKASENYLALNFSTKQLFDIGLGITGKLLWSNMADLHGYGLGLDFGIIKRDLFLKDLCLGLSILNLGVGPRFSETNIDRLPLNFKTSVGYIFNFRKVKLTTGFDLNIPSFYYPNISFGTEFDYSYSENLGAQIRIGFRHPQDNGLFASFGVGAGIRIYYLSIDYAFMNYGVLDNTHTLTLRFKM